MLRVGASLRRGKTLKNLRTRMEDSIIKSYKNNFYTDQKEL